MWKCGNARSLPVLIGRAAWPPNFPTLHLHGWRVGATQQPLLRFEARREKAQVTTQNIVTHPNIDTCYSSFWMRVHDQSVAVHQNRETAHQRTLNVGYPANLASHFVNFFPGGYTEEVTPVPIPNTEVKLFRADGTAGATLWESRTLPGF